MEEIQVLLTREYAPALMEQIRAVDPRIRTATLSRDEWSLMRGGKVSPTASHDKVARSLEEKLRGARIMLGWPDMTAEMLACAPHLDWAHASSAGVDTYLSNGIFRSERVTITNSRGASSVLMAEYILAAMAMMAQQQPRLLRQQQQHHWSRPRPRELSGSTLGIVGLGSIGEETARRARAFGVRIIATRRSATKPGSDERVDLVLPSSALPQLLAESDYVALTLPLTPETKHLIGESELRRMKSTACLINVSRGEIVDEEALIRALQEGWIAGAVLDVFEREPLPADSPLWDLEQAVITPHISGAVDRHSERVVDMFCDNLRRYLAGQPLENIVDRARGY